MKARLLTLVPVLVVVVGCGGGGSPRVTAPDPTSAESITVTSPAFTEGTAIPATYTCQGDGTAPEIQWSGVPSEAGSVAVVVDDPDAPGGDYVHWVVLGLPTGRGGLDADNLPTEATEVAASGGPGWSPPCPPSGTHHYRFTVYAFPSASAFAVSKDAPLQDLLSAVADNAIAWGRLTGTVSASGGGGGY